VTNAEEPCRGRSVGTPDLGGEAPNEMPQLMHSFSIEQALFRQSIEYLPAGAEAKTTLESVGRSSGFHEDWTQHALELIHGFGERPPA